MARTLDTLVVRLTGDAKSYNNMLKQAEGATKRFAEKVGQVGKAITKAITVPLAAVGAASVKAFSDFDSAITKVVAKLGGTTPAVRAEIEKLSTELSVLGETAFSPAEIAGGLEALAGAGIDSVDQLRASIKQLALFAQAGGTDLGAATKQIIGALAGFRKLSKDPAELAANFRRFSDVIVSAATATQVEVADIAASMSGDASAAARQYGASVEELAAVLAVLAKQNIKAEDASNMTGRMFRLLTSSFVKNRAVWVELVGDITDGQGGFRKIGDVIGMVSRALDRFTPEKKIRALEKLGFETLAQKAILPLLGQEKELKAFTEQFRRTGVTAAQSAEQMKSFSNGMKIVKNAVSVAAIGIGQDLAPVLKAIGSAIANVAGWFSKLNPTVRTVIVTVAALAAALGPVLIVLPLLASGWVKATTAAVAFGSAVKTVTLAVVGIKTGLVALAAVGILWWADAKKAVQDYNAAVEESIRLQDALTSRFDKGTAEIQRQAAGMSAGDRKIFLEGQLAKARKEVEDYARAVASAQRRLDEYSTFWGVLTGGRGSGAVKQELSQYQSLLDAARRRAEALQADINSTGAAATDAGVDLEALADMADSAADQQDNAADRLQELMEQGADVTEMFRTPLEKFTDRLAELDGLLRAGAIGWQTYERATAGAREDLEEATNAARRANTQVGLLDATLAGSNEARVRLYEQREALRRSFEDARRVPVPMPNAANNPDRRGREGAQEDTAREQLNVLKQMLKLAAKQAGVRLVPADFNL